MDIQCFSILCKVRRMEDIHEFYIIFIGIKHVLKFFYLNS